MTGPVASVRPLTFDEIGIRIDYFHSSSDDHLRLLGVDRERLPPPTVWREWYREDYAKPIHERESFALAWEFDGHIIGFSSVDRIVFGREAFMHLHIVKAERRRSGLGTEFVRLSAVEYFELLELERLLSEPNAFNRAPNRTFQAAGFRYLYSHHTVPGPMNHPQVVTRWGISRDRAAARAGSP